MSVVLPATIPGLVRRCSPLLSRNGSRGTVYTSNADGLDRWALELLDPTGQHHALLWLADWAGLDASGGVFAETGRKVGGGALLVLRSAEGMRLFSPVDIAPLRDIDPDGEHALSLAIRAAVLHLAGVSA